MTKRKGYAAGGILLAAVGLVLLTQKVRDNVAWRLAALDLKLSGRVQSLSWLDVIQRLNVCAWGDCLRPWVRDSVTLGREVSGGPCPAIWDTPKGPMRGRLEDEFALEGATHSWFDTAEAPKVRPGDVVLEVGAWLGTFTRHALDSGAQLVVAFEPEPVNITCFKHNFEQEIADGRIALIEAASWDSPGRVQLANVGPNNPTGGGKGFAVVPEGPVEAAAVTIDETVQRLGLQRVDFISMDIEGGERYALAGARETIARFAPAIVVCIHHLPDDREVIPPLILNMQPKYHLATTDLKGYFTTPQ